MDFPYWVTLPWFPHTFHTESGAMNVIHKVKISVVHPAPLFLKLRQMRWVAARVIFSDKTHTTNPCPMSCCQTAGTAHLGVHLILLSPIPHRLAAVFVLKVYVICDTDLKHMAILMISDGGASETFNNKTHEIFQAISDGNNMLDNAVRIFTYGLGRSGRSMA